MEKLKSSKKRSLVLLNPLTDTFPNVYFCYVYAHYFHQDIRLESFQVWGLLVCFSFLGDEDDITISPQQQGTWQQHSITNCSSSGAHKHIWSGAGFTRRWNGWDWSKCMRSLKFPRISWQKLVPCSGRDFQKGRLYAENCLSTKVCLYLT